MNLKDAHVVVTGAGATNGIGAALVRRFAAAGARAVVAADLDAEAAAASAAEGAAAGAESLGTGVDVAHEEELARLIGEAEERFGPIDVFCSNAGIAGPYGGPEVLDGEWQRIWEVNVMAHVRAARLLLPGMLDRGHGHLSSTASAAGLLANPGLMTYSVTKHAAVAVAEWLEITYGASSGVSFSCLCPQGVATPMLEKWTEDPTAKIATDAGTISPDEAAEALVEGIRAGTFLVLPHPEVGTYMQRRAGDHARWLGGMQRFQAEIDRLRKSS